MYNYTVTEWKIHINSLIGKKEYNDYLVFNDYFQTLVDCDEETKLLQVNLLLSLVVLKELFENGSIEDFKKYSQYYITVLKDDDLTMLYDAKGEDEIWSTKFEVVYAKINELFFGKEPVAPPGGNEGMAAVGEEAGSENGKMVQKEEEEEETFTKPPGGNAEMSEANKNKVLPATLSQGYGGIGEEENGELSTAEDPEFASSSSKKTPNSLIKKGHTAMTVKGLATPEQPSKQGSSLLFTPPNGEPPKGEIPETVERSSRQQKGTTPNKWARLLSFEEGGRRRTPRRKHSQKQRKTRRSKGFQLYLKRSVA